MVQNIAGLIDAGKIKLYAVDSIDDESWYAFNMPPSVRNFRHNQYDSYITDEVIAFIEKDSNRTDIKPMATGASMGAYHSLNFYLRHPDVCKGVIALSGLYRLDRKEFQLSPDDMKDVYFNSPIHYLPNVNDEKLLSLYRKGSVIICVGKGAWENEAIEDTCSIEFSFREKNIPVWIDYWGEDVNHDWPWWYKQMNYFLGKLHS